MKSILIIDDERDICESIKMILEYEGYKIEYFNDSELGIKNLEHNSYDALLLDIQMPKMNGFEVLKRIQEHEINTSVIMISAHNSLENAVKATKLGAFDFIEKPIDRDKLLITIRNAVESSNLLAKNMALLKKVDVESEIIGNSPAIKNILETIKKVAPTEARVLITGENGTGKELVARALHKFSNRSENNLIEVNCAAIPNELIESELFGHEKGSFTGAARQRIGKFEQADGGILFLDEIGDMSLQAQAKVLRAIEDNTIERVGGNSKIKIDVRIVSATNKDLNDEIKEGNFREDLFHRLNVIPIKIPPLRERVEDIPLLINHFVNIICDKNSLPIKKFSQDATNILKTMNWSGNIRELKNLVERIIIMVSSPEVSSKDLIPLIPTAKANLDDILDISNSFQEFKEKAERAYILKQLEVNNWNISKTAEIIGIQRSHLYSKMKKYEIEKGKE